MMMMMMMMSGQVLEGPMWREMLTDLGIRAFLPDTVGHLDEAVAVYHSLGVAFRGAIVAFRLRDQFGWTSRPDESFRYGFDLRHFLFASVLMLVGEDVGSGFDSHAALFVC